MCGVHAFQSSAAVFLPSAQQNWAAQQQGVRSFWFGWVESA